MRGWDFFANDNNPADDNGHGTYVAGTIAAAGNNGQGVAGVAEAKILPLKFLAADGSGTTSGRSPRSTVTKMRRDHGEHPHDEQQLGRRRRL